MTSNHRRGYDGEHRVEGVFRAAGFPNATRNRQDVPGHCIPDVLADPFCVEVKKGASYRSALLEGVMRQAWDNNLPGMWPVSFIWAGRKHPKFVVMYEHDFMELVSIFRRETR